MNSNEIKGSLTEKFVSGEFHYGLWGIIARGASSINSFIIISTLTVYQYGVFQLLLAGYAFFAEWMSWGGLGVGTDILRFIGRGKEAEAKKLFIEYNALRFGTAIIFWAISFFGAPLLSFRYEADFIGFIKILSFMFLAEALQAAVTTLVNARLDFKALASRRAIGKTFQLIIIAGYIVFATVGIKEVLMALIVSHVLATSMLIPGAVRAWKPWRGLKMPSEGSILWQVTKTHGKWASAKNLLAPLTQRVQPWLIKFFVSTEAVGLYGAATSLTEIVMQLVPRGTMNTLISRIFFDKERSQRVFIFSMKYLTWWGLLGIAGSLLVVPIALPMILPQYVGALPYFYLLLITVPFKSFQWMIDLFLSVFRKQKFAFMRMLSRNALSLSLLAVLLPVIGLFAVPIADIVMRVSIAAATYRYLLKLRPEFKLSPKIFFSFGEEDKKILGQVKIHTKNFFMKSKKAAS